MKHFLLLLGILGLTRCNETSTTSFSVEWKGSMQTIMHQGDISSKANLADFRDVTHLYGLGAVENLKGEILILDGVPYVAAVRDSQLSITSSFDVHATLLVYASVKDWNSTAIPDSVGTYAQLEGFVEQAARAAAMNKEEPFPFMIEGTPESASWHVINWKDGDTVHTHEKHRESGLQGTIQNQPVTILGFYSRHHHGVFTHHSTNVHAHVIKADHTIAGHLDDIALGKGMVLNLPATK